MLLKRSDVNYLFGNEGEMQWQHRLWRYGPNFDPKAKGGIWHKDTCPFGINGALPENSIMFTIVYILYTENLDGPTAGTRVKDDDGTSISPPNNGWNCSAMGKPRAASMETRPCLSSTSL